MRLHTFSLPKRGGEMRSSLALLLAVIFLLAGRAVGQDDGSGSGEGSGEEGSAAAEAEAEVEVRVARLPMHFPTWGLIRV